MGALLPDTPEIRQATAAEKLDTFLNNIEEDLLQGKQIERAVLKKYTTQTDQVLIDISSASTMNILDSAIPDKDAMLKALDAEIILKKAESYPYLVERGAETETAFADFVKRVTQIEIDSSEVLIFNSVYRSFTTLLLALPGQYVIVPEYMHHTQKACFRSAGKQLLEIPITADKLYDLAVLRETLAAHTEEVACAYIYHARPTALDVAYIEKLAVILKEQGVTPLVDLDVLRTQHTDVHTPVLPLTVPVLREQAIYLCNLSKEIGAPGIRIGFGIAPAEIVRRIKKFQQTSFDMIPPVTKYIATTLLTQTDLMAASQELQQRMQYLVDGLAEMSFEAHMPNVGVNLFMHVPRSFEQSTTVLPDHLFAYYCLTRAGVVLRPGSLHGHRLNHYVRFVVGQPVSVITEMLERFAAAGITGDMEMPASLEAEYAAFVKTV